MGKTHAGRQAQRSRAQALAGLQHHRAARHVFALPAYPLAQCRLHRHLHPAVGMQGAVFLHDDGVGPCRHGRTREDAGQGAGGQGGPCAACGNALRHGQGPRAQVGHAQGVAVHGAVVVAGHVQGAAQRLRQHAAVGLKGRNGLQRQHGLGTRQQVAQGVVQGQQRGARRGGWGRAHGFKG